MHLQGTACPYSLHRKGLARAFNAAPTSRLKLRSFAGSAEAGLHRGFFSGTHPHLFLWEMAPSLLKLSGCPSLTESSLPEKSPLSIFCNHHSLGSSNNRLHRTSPVAGTAIILTSIPWAMLPAQHPAQRKTKCPQHPL